MKRYKFIYTSQDGIYIKGDSFYACGKLRNAGCDDNVSLITDSSLRITITNPCGTDIVDEAVMEKPAKSTEDYTYCHNIAANAIVGEYEVKISCSTDCRTIFHSNFYVLPWNLTQQIRNFLGQDAKTIDDADLAEVAWYSYVEVRDATLEYHYREKLCCCTNGICSCCGKVECACDCGVGSPTTCTSWKLNHSPIADFYNDDAVSGCVVDTVPSDYCYDDICCIWKNSDGECQTGAVEVVDSGCGEIKVYQNDGATAIPASNEGIFVSYYSSWESFTIPKFRKAICLLAAYELALRYNLVTKAAPNCDERSKVSFADRLWKRYIDVLDSIKRPQFEGTD